MAFATWFVKVPSSWTSHSGSSHSSSRALHSILSLRSSPSSSWPLRSSSCSLCDGIAPCLLAHCSLSHIYFYPLERISIHRRYKVPGAGLTKGVSVGHSRAIGVGLCSFLDIDFRE